VIHDMEYNGISTSCYSIYCNFLYLVCNRKSETILGVIDTNKKAHFYSEKFNTFVLKLVLWE
jgi:hypothetical protein